MESIAKSLLQKYESLKNNIKSYSSVAVAFSGGLDSGFVLYAAVDALGPRDVIAVTADSESLAREELDYAGQFCEKIGLGSNHFVIKTEELADPNYAANPSNRCFFCKSEAYAKITAFAAGKGISIVLDGSNMSDIGDHRPGREAAGKIGIKSPLIDAGLDKDEVRQIARSHGLEIWDKPQSACLASRIPYGDRITPEKLQMIDRAESFLRERGFRNFRVRHHDRIARLEVDASEFPRLMDDELRCEIRDRLREIGFTWITLDLADFKSGSMNILINKDGEDG